MYLDAFLLFILKYATTMPTMTAKNRPFCNQEKPPTDAISVCSCSWAPSAFAGAPPGVNGAWSSCPGRNSAFPSSLNKYQQLPHKCEYKIWKKMIKYAQEARVAKTCAGLGDVFIDPRGYLLLELGVRHSWWSSLGKLACLLGSLGRFQSSRQYRSPRGLRQRQRVYRQGD